MTDLLTLPDEKPPAARPPQHPLSSLYLPGDAGMERLWTPKGGDERNDTPMGVEESPGLASTIVPGQLLPLPAGWTHAFVGMLKGCKSMPTWAWPYLGIPGGTIGCAWTKKNLRWDGDGAVIDTYYGPLPQGGDGWTTAAFGTLLAWLAPMRIRVTEQIEDTNIEGLSPLELIWPHDGVWSDHVEGDSWETWVRNGQLQPAGMRLHYDQNNTVAGPIPELSSSGTAWHVHEAQYSVDYFAMFRDGMLQGSWPMPVDAWQFLGTIAHWAGVQSETYTQGPSPITAVSRRRIASVEVLVPIV